MKMSLKMGKVLTFFKKLWYYYSIENKDGINREKGIKLCVGSEKRNLRKI